MDFIKLTDNGLQIATRQEIYDQLCVFAKAAYGNDISLDEGTPFECFIGLLADSLSTVNGATQSFSELFSTKELSGNFLDFVAGQRGIVRKVRKNQRVIMTVTVDETVSRPFTAPANTIFIEDTKGRVWSNTTQLFIQKNKFLPDGTFSQEENYQGTCEFGLTPLDSYDADLLYANNNQTFDEMHAVAPSDSIYINHFSFINNVNATPAVQTTENDAQLRARYDAAVYATSKATVEGLRSNLLTITDYVRIVENFTDSDTVDATENPYGIKAHSIWVIVGGGSTASNYNGTDDTVSTDSSDVAIAQSILYYKSLGCGVSVSDNVPSGKKVTIDGEQYNVGNFMVEIPIETITAQIPFTRLVENTVTFNVTLHTTRQDSALRDSVREKVSYELQQYVAGLEPGDVITQVGVVEAISRVLSQYDVGEFDFVSDTVSYEIGTKIEIYQRAVGGTATVKFDDEGV